MEEAISYYEQAVNKDPSIARFHSWLGELYEEKGRVDEALECYKKGAELDPEMETDGSRYFWNLKGKICLEKGNLDGAIAI